MRNGNPRSGNLIHTFITLLTFHYVDNQAQYPCFHVSLTGIVNDLIIFWKANNLFEKFRIIIISFLFKICYCFYSILTFSAVITVQWMVSMNAIRNKSNLKYNIIIIICNIFKIIAFLVFNVYSKLRVNVFNNLVKSIFSINIPVLILLTTFYSILFYFILKFGKAIFFKSSKRSFNIQNGYIHIIIGILIFKLD